jgi:peptidoglycan/xylan/chitin deacetylase (PgdA/CDA1 family)
MVREPRAFTRGLLDRLSKACEVDYPSMEAQSAELMSWEEVRRVSQSVVTIGSHTHTHAVLSTLDREGQIVELASSREILERQLGTRVFSIAYPVGGYAQFTAETKELARDCGYSAGYSFATGVNAWQGLDAYDVKRVSSPVTVAFLAAKASVPGFFARS